MGGVKVEVKSTGSNGRSLTWWGLGAIAFVMTTCGPFGLEAAIDSGGALLTLIAVLLVPIFYVVPQVLMVSELALMMPSNHGYILWVQRGWGPFAAFFNGYNAVIVNTVDLALYPVLASDYVLRLFARIGWVSANANESLKMDFTNKDYLIAIATRLGLIAIGTFVGSLSAANVSSLSVIVCGVVCVVFVALFCWSIPNLDPTEQITYKAGLDKDYSSPQWGAFSAAALWLYTGWNSLGSLAGDVDNDEGENGNATGETPAIHSTDETPVNVVAVTDHHAGVNSPLAPETILTASKSENIEATVSHHARQGVDTYYDKEHATQTPPEILTRADRANIDYSAAATASQTSSAELAPGTQRKKPGLNNVFVKGLRLALVLGVVMYLLPLMSSLTSKTARESSWTDGFLVDALDYALPGSFWVVIVIGILSQFGLFYSSLVCYSRIVWGLAELGWLPSFLARLHPKFGSPIFATLAQAGALIPLMFFDFSYLQRLEFTLAAISYCLTFTAFLRLRYTEAETHRPFTVPGGMPVAWLITGTKVVVMVTVAATNAMDPILVGIAVGINGLIGIAYYFSGGRKRANEMAAREKALESAAATVGTEHVRAAAGEETDEAPYTATRSSVVELNDRADDNKNDLAQPFVGGYEAESPRHCTLTDAERLQ